MENESPINGRPTAYNEQIAKQILDLICDGQSLREICRRDDMPARSTVLLWVSSDRESFSDRYAKACQARAYYWADEILDIADDGTNDWMERLGEDEKPIGYQVNGECLQRSRLRVDTRKWLMSKLIPAFADQPQSAAVEDMASALKEMAQRLPA